MWLKDIIGFDELSHAQMQFEIEAHNGTLRIRKNGKEYQYGSLELATLQQLQQRSNSNQQRGSIEVTELVADVQQLHLHPLNKGALFQAASQFNLLEMVGPSHTPEQGVSGYEFDRTQGPACAIACGAGTIYRNYFVPVNGQIGQHSYSQIDCLAKIGQALGNNKNQLWSMKNGYALPTQTGLEKINQILSSQTSTQRELLKAKLQIGLQWQTEVTLQNNRQLVSQAYCSALPVAYSSVLKYLWEPFARLILEASYEATLHAAVINHNQGHSNKLYLTLLGGGAFGNDTHWITDSIVQSLNKFRNTPLQVHIVSHGSSKPHVRELVQQF